MSFAADSVPTPSPATYTMPDRVDDDHRLVQWQDEDACLGPDPPRNRRQVAAQRQRLVQNRLVGVAEGLLRMQRLIR